MTGRSVTFLDLTGADRGFGLMLLDDAGRRLAVGGHRSTAAPSRRRYFVAVRAFGNASGRYTLTRAAG